MLVCGNLYLRLTELLCAFGAFVEVNGNYFNANCWGGGGGGGGGLVTRHHSSRDLKGRTFPSLTVFFRFLAKIKALT